jgi:hypothetical protein
MDNREELLRRLVRFERPLEPLLSLLGAAGWDSHRELVRVAPADIENALRLFLQNRTTAEQVEEWANAIECREDLAMTELVESVIYELANPLLTEPLSNERTSALIERLHGQPNAS